MKKSSPHLFSLPLLAVLLSACSSVASQNLGFGEQFRPPTLRAVTVDEEVMAKWSRSCALCHITGEAGAPVVGDTAEWQRRLEQGEEAIINNVVEGFNSMPPLGYCMACEVSDFRAMVAYMAGLN
ncbi:MAG: c-type cytochrome [Gammaproteobacteria bacterium]|jgi:cytochrome c5|tara:strand:- start:284 stop:658 length:375 start_codon:yes stop_codon:yes gene_type:complete